MTGAPEKKERWVWWKAHELRINIVATLLCLFLFSVGLALGYGILAGISVLLLIFFGTYTAYAYVRRYW